MEQKTPQLKCLTNIPELVEFKSNTAKTGTGQYGEWYLYSVVNRGVDKIFFPTKFLNDKLQAFQPLQGKTLEVVLIEIGDGKKDWRVTLPGQGGNNVPVRSENVPQIKFDAYKAIQDLTRLVKELDERVKKLEEKDIIDIPGFEGTMDDLNKLKIDVPEGFLQ